MATYTIRTTSVQDWRDTMMSKAEFNALAAERRANRAGSGFDEMGKHRVPTSTLVPVNEGIWTNTVSVNAFYVGDTISPTGTSKTSYAVASVNGSLSAFKYLNDASAERGIIYLPPAPTVLPSTTTLTQQQIDSGVIKHADASNSGLIVNGRNLIDTNGWLNGAGSHIASSGKLQITNGTSVEGYDSQEIVTVIGKKYTFEIFTTDGTSLSNSIKVGNSIGASTLVNLSNIATATRTEVSFTATAAATYLTLGTGTTITGETSLFGEMAVFPADAISRSDLVFLEAWREDVSEKDFVYPLGNTQYLGTTGDSGTPVEGAFAGAATYSLFSDAWQADSALVGKGYVWSTLSDANKKAFVANPENNCYLDGDKVIQVRYRMRVVMGTSDTWNNTTLTTLGSGSNVLARQVSGTYAVKVKGKQVDTTDDVISSTSLMFFSYDHASNTNKETGVYTSFLNTVTSYNGYTFALPIALVHRRNQGMKHDTYNPNGTKLASDSLPWYSTTISFTSISDCFTDSKLLTASGYIGTTTGRADGIFYDQIHESDIIDLRNNSSKVEDYNRLIDREFNKLVAGTYRGTQGELNTEVKTQTTTGTVATVEVNDGTKYKSGDIIYIYDLTASAVKGRYTVKSISTNTLTVDLSFAKLANNYMVSGGSTTRTKSNNITITDLIGSPTNLPAMMKLDGQSFNTLHTAEDGTSLLPTGTTGSDGLAVYKLSRKANATPLQVLKSTDSGATWAALTVTTHYTFSTNTNAITFTAGNIPLVADLVMVTYRTHTNMAVAAVNSEVLAIGDMIKANYNEIAYGGGLVQTIGKVATNITTTAPILLTSPISDYCIIPVPKVLTTDNISWGTKPTHSNSTLIASTSPTVKIFPYLTRSNGKAYLQLVFKEMKYGSYAAPTVVTTASATYTQYMTYKIDVVGCALEGKVIQWTNTTTTGAIDWSLYDVSPNGAIYIISSGAIGTMRLYDGDSWGDDSKFNIVDNISTTTDTNGATVLIGQKRVELNYFIGATE